MISSICDNVLQFNDVTKGEGRQAQSVSLLRAKLQKVVMKCKNVMLIKFLVHFLKTYIFQIATFLLATFLHFSDCYIFQIATFLHSTQFFSMVVGIFKIHV